MQNIPIKHQHKVKKQLSNKTRLTINKGSIFTRRWFRFAIFTVAIGLLGYITFVSQAVTKPPANSYVSRFCGVWALKQTFANTPDQAITNLNSKSAEINSALNYDNMRGFSYRLYWFLVDNDQEFNRQFDAGKSLVDAHPGKDYSIRTVAGKGVPSWIYTPTSTLPASYSYTDDGMKIPKPFSDNANEPGGNTRFEYEYRILVKRMINYANSRGIKLVHFPWYGREWAEINLHPNLQSSVGYTKARWVQAHKNLIDIVYDEIKAYPELSAEFPLSGWNNTGDGPSATTELVNYMLNESSHPLWAQGGGFTGKLLVQGNGYGKYSGRPDIGKMGTPTTKAVYRGMQMYDQTDSYTDLWGTMIGALDDDPLYATYLEIYSESFGYSSQNKTNLQSSINDHYNANCKTTSSDTQLPKVTLVAPANNSTVINQTTIQATASDNVGVTKVEFLLDGAIVNTKTSAPYSYTWDSKTVSNGSHTITAKAHDSAGNSNVAQVTVNVNNVQTNNSDLNNDSKVDVFDLSILLSKWNTNDSKADINKDGKVDVFDLSILLSKWGS